jgi:hypothetical protein
LTCTINVNRCSKHKIKNQTVKKNSNKEYKNSNKEYKNNNNNNSNVFGLDYSAFGRQRPIGIGWALARISWQWMCDRARFGNKRFA